jgi:hypothetical protein
MPTSKAPHGPVHARREPNVGGLLERVEILDGNTTITQQTIRDCVTQQLYALELDPPPDGVSVERELHLEFP